MTRSSEWRIAVEELKARYFRLMDLKRWDDYRDLFTNDMTFWRDASPMTRSTSPATTSADEFVGRIRRRLKSAVTVHHGHMPELELVEEDRAHGWWSMFDWVDDPDRDRAYQGYGFYEDEYVREGDDVWRIASMRLIRLRVVWVPPGNRSHIEEAKERWLRGGPQ